MSSIATLSWNGDIHDAIPRGFSRLSVPEETRERLKNPPPWGWEHARIVIFDRNLDFAQFPIKFVRPDGTVDLGAAVPWPKQDAPPAHPGDDEAGS